MSIILWTIFRTRLMEFTIKLWNESSGNRMQSQPNGFCHGSYVLPLSVEELQHALAVSPKMTQMNPRALVFGWKLTSVCAGLVVIDKEQDIIRLAREYNSH
jgi:hypothetical protein